MSKNTEGLKPRPSQQWQELKAKFDELCTKEATLYRKEFSSWLDLMIQHNGRWATLRPAWNMGATLPDETDIAEAGAIIQKAGATDEDCKAFQEWAKVMAEGRATQREMAIQNAKEIKPPQPAEVAGWIFKPMAYIAAPVELHSLINDVVGKEALLGLFDSKTDTPNVDELLDELMMAEAFNVRCSLTHYTEELRRYNIIQGNDSFFDKDCTRLLFATLKEAVQALKEHSNQPNRLKKDIADIVKRFDDVKVWGIFFQILLLQGLCDMLERLDINEGESGFDEAQALYNWVFEMLFEKMYWFACVSSITYGDGDLLRLEPLCAYLMSTKVGQMVQQYLTQEPQQQNTKCCNQILTKHFQCDKSDDVLLLILEALKTDDRRNKPYLPADTTAAAWLYVCKGTLTNEPVTPLNWLGNQNELALLVDRLFGTYWETAKACFRVDGKEPNARSMANDRSKINSGKKDEPKNHKRLLNILNIGSTAGKQ